MDKDKLIRQLAEDVTRSPEEPSEDLQLALGQLVDRINSGGDPPERPVDWPYLICEAVARRHSD